MIQSVKEFSKEKQFEMFMQGTSFAMYEANRDKNNYEKYKTVGKEELSEETIIDMTILEVLQNLGFPMDRLGTYLYKDMIREIYDKLENMKTIKEVYQYKTLLNELGNIYSSFYLQIAREWKEIGIKSFHIYIQNAIDKIDETKASQTLLNDIYDNNWNKKNYGIDAYKIAAYTLKQNKFFNEKTTELEKKLIKKINQNIPKRIDEMVIENVTVKNDF